jgi:hypothetical protein
MVAALKEELAKLLETRLAWFLVGVIAANHNLNDLFQQLTKFVGF